jgi:hypothetical protein
MVLLPAVSSTTLLSPTYEATSVETISVSKVNDPINKSDISSGHNNNNNSNHGTGTDTDKDNDNDNDTMGNITSACTLDVSNMFFSVYDGSDGNQNDEGDDVDVDVDGNIIDDMTLNAIDKNSAAATTTTNKNNNDTKTISCSSLESDAKVNIIIRDVIDVSKAHFPPEISEAVDGIAVSLPLPRPTMQQCIHQEKDGTSTPTICSGNRRWKVSRLHRMRSTTKASISTSPLPASTSTTTSTTLNPPKATSTPMLTGIMKKSATTTTNSKTMNNSNNKKGVTFHAVMTRKTIHRKDFTPQEKCASWITGEEFMAMRDSNLRLARELNNQMVSSFGSGMKEYREMKHPSINIDGSKSTTTLEDAGRGLERLSRPRVKEQAQRRQLLLNELAELRNHRIRYDSNDLAVLFRSYTEQSAIDARVVAQEDEKCAILCYTLSPSTTTATSSSTVTAAQKNERGSKTMTMLKQTQTSADFADERNDAETSSGCRRRASSKLVVTKTGERICS